MSQPAFKIENIMSEFVQVELRNTVGILTLDREAALNSLNFEMIKALKFNLEAWAQDKSIKAVVIRGKGRAFCAGGDIRAHYDCKQRGDTSLYDEFFRQEYALNYLIKNYPKPYIALLDGITMGGGMGISIHGNTPIVTENTLMAMPESTIGFFTDVGGTYALGKLPNHIGMYLGLIGVRFSADDALALGLAKAKLKSEDLEAFIDSLIDADDVEAAISQFTQPGQVSEVLSHADEIATLFGAESLEEISANLEASTSEFAQQARKGLEGKSPTSLKVIFQAIRTAAKMDFKQAMQQEFRLSQRFIRNDDFAEGVRALLVDKDKNPQWNPATIEAVDDAEIQRYFEPLTETSELEL